ncbi:putative nitrate transporter [Phaeomoniella chlamydospora]|uniref:Nitrate/nitrite transporter n=1 Tax=Phaeomoniella chlamydospora TaxID=158046 RepID=A0A0G2E479_PHACM|nr:putative nitrate transporter [Phaeomoniella chlamydospora]
MGFTFASLWKAPEVNPVNQKARSIPGLNVFNVYGRVFFFSWFGFMIAFWSWYAFPPLLSLTIKKDLHLTETQVLNSNIIALVATLLVRLVAGPACDRFGPRYVFAACLLIGAIPTALAGAAYTASQLMAVRFFVGILGGSFVPCQVWSTGFFDKNVVGTSNAITAGFGNAGGGITYFLMPAIFDSLVSRQHLTPHVAWRVSFIVPFICITVVAISLVLFCPDTPTGKWSERHLHAQQNLASHGITANIVDAPQDSVLSKYSVDGNPGTNGADEKLNYDAKPANYGDHEAQLPPQTLLDTARGEVIVKPTLKEAAKVTISPQTLVTAGCYFCTFGAELAINSILGSYFLKNFKSLGQTGSGRWAAMFGLLNVVFRPIGGLVADYLYQRTNSIWPKKIWLHALSVLLGIFLVVIGVCDPHDKATMMGLHAGMAFFLEAANGANYALVPHIHPFANGIVSGVTGAAGNLGGIVFAIIFRYQPKEYAKTYWVIGIMIIGINLCLSWIRPIPKGQIGGH